MLKEYELTDAISELAGHISSYSSNPSTWLRWVVYLLSQLEEEAMDVNPTHQEVYNDMLSNLQDSLRGRLNTGGW